MPVDVLLGLQWGDEGKGKIVDFLAPQYQIIARFQGGPNAGHTLYIGDQKIVLHTVPSGILNDHCINLIGNGVVIDPVILRAEIKKLSDLGVNVAQKLYISRKAHLILPTHRILDAASEAAKGHEKIGSTLRGIGPAYMDVTGRNGLRVGDIFLPGFQEEYARLRDKHLRLLAQYDFAYDLADTEKEWMTSLELFRHLHIVDGEYFIHKALSRGQYILAEGAQGSMLDVTYGTYPWVTSSNTLSSGALSGLGIAPRYVREVYGVTKAYCTRVGGGPFPSELTDATGDRLRQLGREFGATTGRPRRCGWIDLPALRYAIMLNGVTRLVMTKADILDDFEEIAACSHYHFGGQVTDQVPFDMERQQPKPIFTTHRGWLSTLRACGSFDEMPAAFKNYLRYLEDELSVSFVLISTGPGRDELILRG